MQLVALTSSFNNIFSVLQHFHFSRFLSPIVFRQLFFREAVILRIGKMVYKMAPKIIEIIPTFRTCLKKKSERGEREIIPKETRKQFNWTYDFEIILC